MSEWRPIETAPKDGSQILVVEGKRIAIAQWGNINTDERPMWAWSIGDPALWGYLTDPTHWMPLPEPPT